MSKRSERSTSSEGGPRLKLGHRPALSRAYAKLSDARWQELQARFDAERQQAEAAIRTADATQRALSEPDDEALVAVERLRADLSAAVTDAAALPRYHALVVKLFEHVEVLQADEDAPERMDDFPETPSFAYRARQGRTGPSETHRYYLLPVLRPELAMLYGGDPIAFMGANDLIEQNGWAWQASSPMLDTRRRQAHRLRRARSARTHPRRIDFVDFSPTPAAVSSHPARARPPGAEPTTP